MTETVENPTLSLPDVMNAVRIIDVAAERGAFKGNELSQVGAVRDKISKFIEHAQAQQNNESEPEETPAPAPAPAPAKKSSTAKKGK